MHGKFPNYLDKSNVDVELTFQRMKPIGLKGETEDSSLQQRTRHSTPDTTASISSSQEATDQCQMYHTQPETVEHIISGCQTLAADQLFNRHNQVAVQLHLDIWKHYGIKMEEKYWNQHKPEGIIGNDKATILWDSPIITDRDVPYNNPDIVTQEKQTDRCMIIDMVIPSDYSIQKKATEKISKYVDLQIEHQRMWNKRVQVIPVIIGATGVIDNNIKKYIGNIAGHHNINYLQRSAILVTVHILKKPLSIKPESVTGHTIQTM